jgi:hypothetical protein
MSENRAHHLTGILKYESSSESEKRLRLLTQLQNTTIPNDQILENLGLFLDSKNLSRLLFLDFIYQKILETPGQILDK